MEECDFILNAMLTLVGAVIVVGALLGLVLSILIGTVVGVFKVGYKATTESVQRRLRR